MCYLVAKNIDKEGCVALRTTHGKHLADFKRRIEKMENMNHINL
mgnify:CR=1 FL=1